MSPVITHPRFGGAASLHLLILLASHGCEWNEPGDYSESFDVRNYTARIQLFFFNLSRSTPDTQACEGDSV